MKTAIGVASRGVIAGLAGTAAMDAYWYTRALTEGRRDNLLHWEFGAEKSWDKVGAPAQMGRLMVERVTHRRLDARWAPLTNNVMHWGYGTGSTTQRRSRSTSERISRTARRPRQR